MAFQLPILFFCILAACQSQDRLMKSRLTNDSVKYWDIYEQTQWNNQKHKYETIKGLQKNHTCWAFYKDGRWVDYSIRPDGKLVDKNIIRFDVIVENKWELLGDKLGNGKGGYRIEKIGNDTLELKSLLADSSGIDEYIKLVIKLVVSKDQTKQFCQNSNLAGDCQ
jgi:hypothetical protein